MKERLQRLFSEDLNAYKSIEQLLIGFLTTSKASRGTQAMVFLLLETEEQQLAMCSYLSENPTLTDKEIMEMAQKISKQLQQSGK